MQVASIANGGSGLNLLEAQSVAFVVLYYRRVSPIVQGVFLTGTPLKS